MLCIHDHDLFIWNLFRWSLTLKTSVRWQLSPVLMLWWAAQKRCVHYAYCSCVIVEKKKKDIFHLYGCRYLKQNKRNLSLQWVSRTKKTLLTFYFQSAVKHSSFPPLSSPPTPPPASSTAKIAKDLLPIFLGKIKTRGPAKTWIDLEKDFWATQTMVPLYQIIPDSFSCRNGKLSGIMWTPIWLSSLSDSQ